MCVLILSGRHRSNRNQCHIGTGFRYPTLTVICTLCQTKFKISPKYFEFELHLQLSSQVQLIRPMSAGNHIAKASKALFWNEIITTDTKLKKLTTAQLNRWKLRADKSTSWKTRVQGTSSGRHVVTSHTPSEGAKV